MNLRPHGRKPSIVLWTLVIVLAAVTSGVVGVLALTAALATALLIVARRRPEPAKVTRGVRSWELARARTSWLEPRV